MIEFKSVNFSHGSTTLFSHLSFHLEKGKYLVISGAARSGKTTLVRLIAGLNIPSGGEIYIAGEPFMAATDSRKKLRDIRRLLAGVGGIYTLIEDLTIFDNILLLCEIAGINYRVAHRSAMEACSRYRLMHAARQYPSQVSEVERRTTLLARAEAAHKSLIIADAPTDGLDPESAAFIHDRLALLHAGGVTILYLTSGPGPESGPDEYCQLRDGVLAVC